MSSCSRLRVGDIKIRQPGNAVGNELMALFREDMFCKEYKAADEYYTPAYGYEEDSADFGKVVEVSMFRASGPVIAARLDIIGVDETAALGYLSDSLASRQDLFGDKTLAQWSPDILEEYKRDRELRASLDGPKWVELLAGSGPESPGGERPLGSRKWLLDELDYADERYAIRAVLLAFPDAEVLLDVTDLQAGEDGWASEPSLAELAITGTAGMHAPVVVLTEGKTDAEFLSAALRILYPHLTDLVRFLDYEGDRRPEGGVGALARMVRAFAAAGIVNRVIAVFDNDAAAADALRAIDASRLPPGIQVMQYPAVEFATRYPTFGPPTATSPAGSISLADVNGLAGSIELYLGKDVLTLPDGTLTPVQWTSYIPGVSRYQGEITQKERIHRAFRAKCAVATDEAGVAGQDWDGVRAIIDAICAAARSAFPREDLWRAF